MSASLFYQAIEAARNGNTPDTIAGKLATVSLTVLNSRERFEHGINTLRQFTAQDNSVDSLQETLPVFADFFGYIY